LDVSPVTAVDVVAIRPKGLRGIFRALKVLFFSLLPGKKNDAIMEGDISPIITCTLDPVAERYPKINPDISREGNHENRQNPTD